MEPSRQNCKLKFLVIPYRLLTVNMWEIRGASAVLNLIDFSDVLMQPHNNPYNVQTMCYEFLEMSTNVNM